METLQIRGDTITTHFGKGTNGSCNADIWLPTAGKMQRLRNVVSGGENICICVYPFCDLRQVT